MLPRCENEFFFKIFRLCCTLYNMLQLSFLKPQSVTKYFETFLPYSINSFHHKQNRIRLKSWQAKYITLWEKKLVGSNFGGIGGFV